MTWIILQANALHIPLADNCVHVCVSSPPYWGLRSYLQRDDPLKGLELGREGTVEGYIENMVLVFREVRRVLRDDGVLFLNLGDSYAGGGSDRGGRGLGSHKPLDLCNIPHRVAQALQVDGWYWRSTIVLSKVAVMPESVSGWRWVRHRVKVANLRKRTTDWAKNSGNRSGDAGPGLSMNPWARWEDCPGCPTCEQNDGLVLRRGAWRPTTAQEYLFMLTKSPRYFCDEIRVKEAAIHAGERKVMGSKSLSRRSAVAMGVTPSGNALADAITVKSTRNLRSVWSLSPEPLSLGHYAAFPTGLVKRCLEIATSPKGCCPRCGSQWAPIVNTVTDEPIEYGGKRRETGFDPNSPFVGPDLLGYRPTCSCPSHQPVPAVVFDPFMGSGTVPLVADRMGLRGIGLDLNATYCQMARRRLIDDAPLFNGSPTDSEEVPGERNRLV